jgi:Tol biopolymer transport system component
MRNLTRALVVVATLLFVACEDRPHEPQDQVDPVLAKGGKPDKPGDGGGGETPTEPEIVYVGKSSKAFGIYGMAADGSGKSLIWKCRDSCWRPQWSPDGENIVFDYLNRGTISLWIVNKDGSGLTRLIDHDGRGADWSPDGSRLAFTRVEEPSSVRIHVIDADGSNLTYFEPPAGYWDSSPAWSPDGTRIAFRRDGPLGGNDLSAILVMDADGTNVQEVTAPGTYSDDDPAWSPDGSWIAFSRDAEEDPHKRVFIVRPDGTGLTNLTATLDHGAGTPSWSPDGTKIVFDGGNWGIYTMNADGSNVTIIDPTSDSAAHPDWRP